VTTFAFLLCLAAADPAERPAKLVLVSNSAWKGSPTGGPGWETDDFDDSKWDPAHAGEGPAVNGNHYTTDNAFAQATKAAWIWGGRNDTCYLRRTFDVPRGFRRAEMLFAADDVAEIHLNGRLIAGYDTERIFHWGHKGCAALTDLAPYLREGRNVLAVRMQNRIGPRGFALELRVDEDPFLAPPEKAKPLPKELEKEFDTFVPKLDADEFTVRQEATQKLLALIEKHGAVLRGKIEALQKHENAEVRKRGEELWEALRKKIPNLDDDPDADIRLVFPRLDLVALGSLLTETGDKQTSTLRALVPASRLALSSEKALCDLLRKQFDGASDVKAERLVVFVATLELRDLADVLAKLVETRPKTPAGAAAVSALGRLRAKDQTKVLEAATKCGHEPTERAAKLALRAFKE
jgi:hypothetical protein